MQSKYAFEGELGTKERFWIEDCVKEWKESLVSPVKERRNGECKAIQCWKFFSLFISASLILAMKF